MGDVKLLKEMGVRIGERRRELHFTQELLAEKMDVSVQMISNLELGKKAIRPENLANLCAHLGVTADFVLYGKRNEHQMNALLEKISTLTQEEYQAICDIVDLFQSNK